MVVIIKKGENVTNYIASVDDAKMDVNGCNVFGSTLLEGKQVQRLQGVDS